MKLKIIVWARGGGLLINTDIDDIEKAEIIREKGTNRSKFWRGEIDKYTWVDYGSSYLPSELNAAYLWGQLEVAEQINDNRLHIWNRYQTELQDLKELIDLPFIPEYCEHNAHMFFIKCKNLNERTKFISHMKEHGIGCVFHYIPLHSAPAGLKFGYFYGEDVYTTKESERLVRLPLWYGMTDEDVDKVVGTVKGFWNE